MELLLLKAIEDIAARDEFRFHTPGHKGTLSAFDITEIGEEFPGELLAAAQNKTAKHYGSRHCRYLTGGSSMGIKASVLAAGGDVVTFEGRHRAVDEAAALAGVRLYIAPQRKAGELFAPPTAGDVMGAMDRHPEARAVLITSPDYFGRAAGLDIAAAVKERGKLLIVDSAHGAHFPFRPDLFPPSFSSVADFCNLSAHKTLPAYTQSAYLCVNNEEYLPHVDNALRLLGTTSPSYLLLSGLEYAAEYAAEFGTHYLALKNACDHLRADVDTVPADDFTRVVVDAGPGGGRPLYDRLKAAGIFAELCTERYVLFIVTIMDSARTVEALRKGLVGEKG